MPHIAFPDRTRLGARLAALAMVASTSAAGAQDQPPTVTSRPAEARRPVAEGLDFANGLYRNRRYDLAAEEYERFLRSARPGPEADMADAWFGLGNARLFLGKYKEARQAFEAFVKLAPDHPGAATGRYRIGETAYVLGDLAEARRSLEAYAAGTSGDRRYAQAAWSHLGDIASRQADLPGARRAYENALRGDPQGSLANRARLGLGRTLAAQREAEPALKVLKELAARGGPEWADKAWLQIGVVEVAAGRPAEAVEAFEALEKAVPQSPLVAEARVDRAEALAQLGRRDEAEGLLRPIAADPAQPMAAQAADALGSLLLAGGKPAEALAAFDAALERPSASASLLRFHAAEASLALGRADDARARFLKLAADDPKAPWADDAQLRAAALALDAKDLATARQLAGPFAARFPESPLRADARLIDARAALASGRSKEAISILDAAMAEDKPGPAVAQAAYYYLGLAYQKEGRPEKAAEYLGKLAGTTAAPVAADARFMLGQIDFEAGRYAEAIPALQKYLAEKPGGEVAAPALARIALAQAALGQPDEASATLARLADGFPDSPALPPTRVRLAETALAAKQYDRAAGLFRPAAEGTDPTIKGRALSGLGWALLQGGHPAEAAEAFAGLIGSMPDDPLVPAAAFARGRALEDAGQADPAATAYAQAVEKYPKAAQAGPAALAMARLQAEAKRPEAASRAFALVAKDYAATSGEPADAVLVEWGWSLVDAGRAGEADAVFGRLLAEFPDGPHAADARFNLAESAFAARDFDRVLDLLKPVAAEGSAAKPALIQSALYRLGRAQAEKRDRPGASASFARLVADYPDGPFRREGRFWKAEVAFQAGDAKAAEANYAALAAGAPAVSDPKGLVATARGRRAQCLVQLGRWADALAAADAFKADHPADQPADPLGPEVDYARGRALQGLARFEEAREAFDRAIEARKGSELAARAQLMRGETFFHQEQYRDALREFYRVVIQYNAPEWQAVALLEAGKVHEKLDQWTEAAETYEKLRARFPGDRNVDEAGRRIEAARRRVARPPAADVAPAR